MTNQYSEFRDEGQTNVAVDRPGSQMLSRVDIVGIPKKKFERNFKKMQIKLLDKKKI
jgi:hypothetical protein